MTGMRVLTLVGAPLAPEAALQAASLLRAQGAELEAQRELSEGEAEDLLFQGGPEDDRALAEAIRAILPGVDVAVQPVEGRRKRLLAADMDSTMVTGETIDELAEAAGVGPQVAAITQAAMRGELDFEQALDSRLAQIKGLPEAILQQVSDRLVLSQGARELVAAMRWGGAFTMLVSGGFHGPADDCGRRLGFDFVRANRLIREEGRLTGAAERPLVTGEVKLALLQERAAALGIGLEAAMAVGDGSNDIPMLQAAGLGIAYRAKPKTRAAARFAIDHTDLRTALFYQGYDAEDIAEAVG
ncbi:phosphoserine phosphatase SerB [Neomegalonema perideroedes]|uniref:phosphoserine phosphatase SerB n=1 Tax=Neomegalonema perideroedes TaxID=217219 RepID=UPI00037EA146|nr:phosphoserine phosphatase SerB [Neomegalonema perideroedes]